MARNNSRGTATSAIWKTTFWAWHTTFAPILISFSRNVVSGVLEAGIAAADGPGGDEVAILLGCGCPALRFELEVFIPWNASDIETELVIFGAIGGGVFHVCVLLLGWSIG
jgi:hypothetical protein